MKRCPNCNDFALYDDNMTSCPICDGKLVSYKRSGSSSSLNSSREPVRPNSAVQQTSDEDRNPEFETISGFRYHYRGIITEIDPHSRLHSRFKKWTNSIFRGEPYQLGNTSHDSVIRIEEFHSGRVAGRKRDLIFFGDVEGRFKIGDDVSISAKKRGDRYIVTRMYLNETESAVRPGFQIPAIVVAGLTLAVIALIIFLVSGIINFVSSGTFIALLERAIIVIVIIVALFGYIRSRFRRRY